MTPWQYVSIGVVALSVLGLGLMVDRALAKVTELEAVMDERHETVTNWQADAREWMAGVEATLPARDEPTVEAERVLVEHWADGVEEPQRPTPGPRVATEKRELGGRTFEFRADASGSS